MISDDNATSPDNDSASPYNLGWLRMDDFITYQVVVLAQMFGREATRTYAEKWGLSLPRYRVLTVLGNYHRCPCSNSPPTRRWTRARSAGWSAS